MKLILALDIGIASVGWAVLDKESETVLEAGSNIFPEASAAGNQVRREMRQARRIKRRQKTRLDDFNKLWEKNNLSIPQYKSTEIVNLKVKALREEISLDELYLILYSYLKHRGISYLEDAQDDSLSSSNAYTNGLKENAKALEKHYPCEIQRDRLQTIGKYRGQTQITDDNNEKIDLSNVFTIGAYRKEIKKVLETQKLYHNELTDELCDDYILIFNRKRKYYEGPGNEKSRTDYGRFTTRLDQNGNYIDEENIFEKLIGKCSVYPDELRGAAASYTAQEFNLLNDLNNLTINGRKLEESEKHAIVQRIKTSNSILERKKVLSYLKSLHLARKKAMICNQQHLPTGFYSSYDNHSRSSKVIGFQIEKDRKYYGDLWKKIVTVKIENQAKAYGMITDDKEGADKIREFSRDILNADKSNREAHAAKVYFNLLMGTSFSRGNEDILLNSGLDYGYAVLRGYIARACVGYGLNTQIGIHHKSEYNRFNLVDDLMEPLRPMVDIVAYNSMKNDEYFTPEHRRKLVNILNMKIVYRNKKMYVCNMIENYVEQYASFVMGRIDDIVFPRISELVG